MSKKKATKRSSLPTDEETPEQVEDDTTETTETADAGSDENLEPTPDADQDELSAHDRLDELEQRMDRLQELVSKHVSPQGQVEHERNLAAERGRKVPYKSPIEIPPGLTPNQRINLPMVRNAAVDPTRPVAPMTTDQDEDAGDYLQRQLAPGSTSITQEDLNRARQRGQIISQNDAQLVADAQDNAYVQRDQRTEQASEEDASEAPAMQERGEGQ